MKKDHSITILNQLVLFSSALFSIITPMAKELTFALSLSSEEQIAFINSMFLMIGAISSLVWAILGDKFSRKNLLIIATLEWAVFTLITIFSTDFYSLLIFQLLTAIGFGAALPLTFSLIVDLVKPQDRGKRFGFLSAIYVMGNGLGQILSGFLIDYYIWQVPIIIVSIGGFICVFLLFLVNEPTRGARDDLYKTLDADALAFSYKIKLKDFKEIWNIKSSVLILVLNFAMFISIGAISSFFISMLKNDFNLSSTIATVFLIIVFGSQIPSGPIFGKLGDKKYINDKNGRIKVVLFCLLSGSILYVIAFPLALISNSMIIVIIFLFLTIGGAFLFGGIDPLTQATLGEINPPQTRSTIFSINFLAYTFGRGISLLLLGYFYLSFNYLYSPGYTILAIMALMCNLFLIPILKLLPRDIEKIRSSRSEDN